MVRALEQAQLQQAPPAVHPFERCKRQPQSLPPPLQQPVTAAAAAVALRQAACAVHQYMRLAKQFHSGSAAAIPDDLRHLK
jgi:hypothetical protein